MILSSNSIGYDYTDNFTFNNDYLLFVNSFKYLGMEFQQNRLFTKAIRNRALKAESAFFAIRKACATDDHCIPSLELITKLFQSKINPIITYGSSIRSPKSNNTILLPSKSYDQ